MLELGGDVTAVSSWVTELRAGVVSEAAPVRACTRCGRKLTKGTGLRGPVCERKHRAAIAALRRFQRYPAASRAADLLEDEALVPTGVPGQYQVPSAGGSAVYLTDVNGCNCPAGLHDKLCHHRVAVIIARSFYLRQSQIRSAGVTIPGWAVDQPTASSGPCRDS